MQSLIAFFIRPEAVSEVISGAIVRPIIPDKLAILRDSSLKPFSINYTRSHRRRHFRRFVCDNFRPEAGSDIVSGVAVELIDMDFRVKSGDSRSNRY